MTRSQVKEAFKTVFNRHCVIEDAFRPGEALLVYEGEKLNADRLDEFAAEHTPLGLRMHYISALELAHHFC